eukprot:15472942-Alexandrium_andersonii.AAC.1
MSTVLTKHLLQSRSPRLLAEGVVGGLAAGLGTPRLRRLVRSGRLPRRRGSRARGAAQWACPWRPLG